MALKIGRAGLTLALPEPQSWNSSGNQVTLTGTVGPVNPVTDALRLRDQLLGYVDNGDEPIVPVIIDGEPRLTGYYRVLGVQIPTDAVATALGIFSYSVQLQPVQGFTQPWLECIVSGALLTNAVGAVAADMMGFHAAAGSAIDYFPPFTYTQTIGARTGSDGVQLFYSGNGAGYASGTGRYALAPANFYVAGAMFEQGSPLQPVVGRTLEQLDVVNWRLSNSLVRVTPGAAGTINVSHYNGTTWSAVKTYKIGQASSTITGLNSLVILRNSVEETTIRLSLANNSINAIFNLDLSLRRGDRIVRALVSAPPAGGTVQFKGSRSTVEAATAITYSAVTLGGIRATANDADGNRYIILQYQGGTPTNDLVNGAITAAFASSADFGISSEIGGSAAVAPDRAVDIAQQYLAAQSESQRVVAR